MIDTKPHLLKADIPLFEKYVKKANVYFEYGSGGSTNYVSTLSNLKKIYSVESDIFFHRKLKKEIKNISKVEFIVVDLMCKPNKLPCAPWTSFGRPSFGRPGRNCSKKKIIEYQDSIKKVSEKIDVVFVDGRFRVCCCLKCHKHISKDTVVLFDDFFNRPEYHIVLDFYNIIERAKNGRMAVLTKKITAPHKRLIYKYLFKKR